MAALLLLLASLHLAVGTASHILDDSESYHVAPYQLSKRDLEFNSYVPAYRLRGEPSCEELRTMWRLSKREARRATSTNQLPRTRPYRYGRLRAFAPSAAYGLRAHSFGAMKYDERHRHQYRMPHAGAFKKLRALIGGRRRGAFNDLRDEVGKERATNPEDTPQGQYDKLRGMLLNEKDEETSPQPLALSLRARDDGGRISTRRDPRVPLRSRYYREGFTGRLYPGDPKMSGSSEDRQLWESNHESIPYDARDCGVVHMTECHSDSECACDGQFLCSNFRCVVMPRGVRDNLGIWYSDALTRAMLRDWPVPPTDLQ